MMMNNLEYYLNLPYKLSITPDLEEGGFVAEYSGQFKLRIPKSLHRTLALHAKEEGVSMNQYCATILAKYA